jgi:hypothetical protein|tara:strand:- start:4246 stop:4434 length:189 start_codon:yes stop_codon:yes gene_type:complete
MTRDLASPLAPTFGTTTSGPGDRRRRKARRASRKRGRGGIIGGDGKKMKRVKCKNGVCKRQY